VEIIMKRQLRRKQGQGLAELCAGLIVCIPVVMTCIDLGFIALGASINDSVCRDAVRAAASGRPQVTNPTRHTVNPGQEPFLRAVSVIKTHNPTQLPIKISERPVIFEAVRDIPPAAMGGAVEGEVEVKTTVVIVPPFVVRAIAPGGVNLSSTHAIPYTYSVRQVASAAGADGQP
jgi:hypothetical protein